MTFSLPRISKSLTSVMMTPPRWLMRAFSEACRTRWGRSGKSTPQAPSSPRKDAVRRTGVQGPRAAFSAGCDSGEYCCGAHGCGQNLLRSSSPLLTVFQVLYNSKREATSRRKNILGDILVKRAVVRRVKARPRRVNPSRHVKKNSTALLNRRCVALSRFSPRERCAERLHGSGAGAGRGLRTTVLRSFVTILLLGGLGMRTTFDFAPLWRSTIGFDHLAGLVDTALRQATDDNYPPYNIERSGEDHYRITLAVAGFGANDITVVAEQNALTSKATSPRMRP